MRDIKKNILKSNFKDQRSGGGSVWKDEQQDIRDG